MQTNFYQKGEEKMISCTQFIPAYSEGFKFLDTFSGRKGLEKFWSFLSEVYLKDTLDHWVSTEGLEGCYAYWSHSLNEEAADFVMTLDEIKGEFRIDMIKCPSRSMLNDLTCFEMFPSYCDHCEALYRPVLEKYGYKYDTNLTRCNKASCSLTVSIRASATVKTAEEMSTGRKESTII